MDAHGNLAANVTDFPPEFLPCTVFLLDRPRGAAFTNTGSSSASSEENLLSSGRHLPLLIQQMVQVDPEHGVK